MCIQNEEGKMIKKMKKEKIGKRKMKKEKK
jgi:hypothetical protein